MKFDTIINIILIVCVITLFIKVTNKECYTIEIKKDLGYSCVSEFDYKMKGFCMFYNNTLKNAKFIFLNNTIN